MRPCASRAGFGKNYATRDGRAAVDPLLGATSGRRRLKWKRDRGPFPRSALLRNYSEDSSLFDGTKVARGRDVSRVSSNSSLNSCHTLRGTEHRPCPPPASRPPRVTLASLSRRDFFSPIFHPRTHRRECGPCSRSREMFHGNPRAISGYQTVLWLAEF